MNKAELLVLTGQAFQDLSELIRDINHETGGKTEMPAAFFMSVLQAISTIEPSPR